MKSFQDPYSNTNWFIIIKGKRLSRFAYKVSLILLVATTACKKKEESSGDSSTLSSNLLESEFIQSLKFNDFCSSVGFLELYDEAFKDDIAMLCNGDQPAELFGKIIEGAFDESSFESYPYEKITELENERSDFNVAFALKIPKLSAIDIRESDLNRVLQSEVKEDFYEVAIEPISETKVSGLNFLRLTQKYKTLVKGPQSTEFRNERITETNHYQVSVQREDIAMSTEHLKDASANPDYDWARTLNVVVGNPKEGGSFIISVIHFRTWNQGFHKLNTRALDAITKTNARKVYDYLIGLGQ
jgi:hypothetical protein